MASRRPAGAAPGCRKRDASPTRHLLDEHEPEHRCEERQHRPDDPGPEQGSERRGQPLGDPAICDEHLAAEAEQRVAPLWRVRLGSRQQALRGELLGEPDDLLLVHPTVDPLRQAGSELGDPAPAVDAVEQRVQEWPELDHLPVGAPDERGAALVPAAVDVPEQLDAARQVERALCGRLDLCVGLGGRGHAATSAFVTGRRPRPARRLRSPRRPRASGRSRGSGRPRPVRPRPASDVRRDRGVDRRGDVRVGGAAPAIGAVRLASASTFTFADSRLPPSRNELTPPTTAPAVSSTASVVAQARPSLRHRYRQQGWHRLPCRRRR